MNPIALNLVDQVQNQSRTLIISPDGNQRTLRADLRWRKQTNRWYMDVYDVLNEKYLITNVPILCSDSYYHDLLEQFEYMQIGSSCVLPFSMSDEGVAPTWDTLTKYQVVWCDRIKGQ